MLQIEAHAGRLHRRAAHQDVSRIARVDAPVTVNHARAVIIPGSQPMRRGVSVNGLNRSKDDIRAGTLGQRICKPARRGQFIVIEECNPIAPGEVEASISRYRDVRARCMEIMHRDCKLVGQTRHQIAGRCLRRIVRNHEPDPDMRRQRLLRDAMNSLQDLRTAVRADADVHSDIGTG